MTDSKTASVHLVPAIDSRFVEIDTLVPYARNARTHSPEQVAQIAASIEEFGFTNPVLADDRGIIAGHGRVMAARLLYERGRTIRLPNGDELPPGTVLVVDVSGWSDAQRKAYILADNELAAQAGWDLDLLRLELEEIEGLDFDLSLIGFSQERLDELMGRDGDKGLTDPDAIPEAPSGPPVSSAGDVWALGDSRVMCGDSTNAGDVARLVEGHAGAALLHADPPYGMGKEADGVAGDNVYGDKLDAFQMEWWRAFRPHLAPNASAYIWGNAPELWSLWYAGGLGASEPLTFRNELVWDKRSIAGMAAPDVNLYPIATERALFFQLGRHVFLVGQTKDDYWPGWEPVRAELVAERDKAGWSNGDVNRICSNHMAGHWFGTSQWVMISEDNWEKLKAAADGLAFTQAYGELRARYSQALAIFKGEVRDPRREGFDAARPYFDNAHDIMRDVWEFGRVHGEERHGHATPKPVAIMERIMRSSAREGELCLEPFAGSGSTIIGAVKSGRRCFAMEMQPAYVDVCVSRWERYTGKQATLEGDGRTFADVAEARRSAAA